MQQSGIRLLFVLATLTGSLGEASTAAAASDPSCDAAIPTQLVAPTFPPERPIPICRRCQIVVTQPTNEAAQLQVAYFDQQTDLFVGSIEIVVWLGNGDEHIINVPGVLLRDGDTRVYDLEPDDRWSWAEVIYAWVELVPEH